MWLSAGDAWEADEWSLGYRDEVELAVAEAVTPVAAVDALLMTT